MSKPSHKPQLDALRAIAVGAVLVHHFLTVERLTPDDFLTLGLLAVRLFFCSERVLNYSHPRALQRIEF